MDLLVNIDVPDLASARAFYTEAFGLKVRRHIGDDALELLGAELRIYLLARAAGTSASTTTPAPRTYERHWKPVHLDFVVEDIDAALERALAAGAILEIPIRTAVWGRIAGLTDPFGNGFCFIQFLGRGYDEIATPDEP